MVSSWLNLTCNCADEALLDAAYRAARRVLKKDPTLERFPALAEELKRRQQLDDLCDRAVLN